MTRIAGTAAALVIALLSSVVMAVTIGPANIGATDALSSLGARLGFGASTLSPLQDAIVWDLRLPRILTAACVGAGLAVAGAVMQSLLRNPLADPYVLGLSSGASTGAVLVLVLGLAVALPFAAFAGTLLALLLTLTLARASRGASSTATVLAGLAVSAALSAVTSLIIFWSASNDSYREILAWLLGSLAGADWAGVLIVAIAVAVSFIPLMAYGPVLDAFALGDTAVTALGVPAERTRMWLLVLTALLTGALVSVSGSIGFLGLILPHAVRLIVGYRSRAVLPLAALAGAIFLLWADTAARTIFDPRELPVGIVTALIGAPVFAAILITRGRRA